MRLTNPPPCDDCCPSVSCCETVCGLLVGLLKLWSKMGSTTWEAGRELGCEVGLGPEAGWGQCYNVAMTLLTYGEGVVVCEGRAVGEAHWAVGLGRRVALLLLTCTMLMVVMVTVVVRPVPLRPGLGAAASPANSLGLYLLLLQLVGSLHLASRVLLSTTQYYLVRSHLLLGGRDVGDRVCKLNALQLRRLGPRGHACSRIARVSCV